MSLQQEAQKQTVAEMLLNQDLNDIVNKTFSEQVVYLLEERARLLRKVKEMQGMSRQDCCSHVFTDNREKMGNVKDEMEQLRIAPQQEQEKADSQQETLRSSAFEFRTLTSENIQLQSHTVDLEQDSLKRNAKERRKLLEDLRNALRLLISTQQDLLCQRHENSELQGQIEHLEQKNLKVAAELKEAQSRLEQLERRDKNSTAQLQISEKRNTELKQQLKTLLAQVQNEKTPYLQVQQQEFACIRTQIDALKNELVSHKARWEDKSFILSKHQEELATIRTQIPAIDKEITDLKQIMATTREPKLEETQITQEQQTIKKEEMTEEPCSLKVQEVKRVCQGIMETLRDTLSCNQQKIESLQKELIQTLNKLGTQSREFKNKEIHYKDKLSRAKDVYLRETAWRDDKIKQQDRELRSLTLRLEKEREMVKNMMNQNEKLLRANISLELRLSDQH